MLISFDWLKEFINIRQSPEEVAGMLTMSGLEVDSSEVREGDTIFDVDLTPNRGDCLSVLGTARELCAVSGRKIKMPRFRMPSEDKRSWIKVSIENRDLCPRYAGRVIKGVKVEESPDWLKMKLEKSGIRPINNVVDVTNYVLLEYGQPLHAFDLEKLAEGHIRVASPGKSVAIVTLDGVKRRISKEMLLIWDGDTPVAVAGVMGGLSSEVSAGTTGIFLESACFDASSVRRTSSRLGVKTESSFRFERGIDILNVDRALDRASYLISELAGGLLCKGVDVFPRKYRPRSIKLKYKSVEDLLGITLSGTKVQDLISRTGAQIEDDDEYLHVEVPSYRNDIESEVDLIEEVARLYGYHKIKPVAPRVSVSTSGTIGTRKKIGSIKQLFCSRGYTEVINYSFMNPIMIGVLNIPENDPRANAVPIMNPLKQEESLARTMMVPSLIDNLIYNYNRGIKGIRLFEISKVFIGRNKKGERLPEEILKVGGISLAEKAHQLWSSGAEDFYTVKGDLDAMISELYATTVIWERSSEPFLHPGKSADLVINKNRVGFVGVLSPEILSELDVKIHNADVIVFEFDLDMILKEAGKRTVYERFSKYPFVQRDISILVDAEMSAQDVLIILRTFKSDLIDDVRVFDFYKGKNIPEGKVSLAFSVTYRSVDRTLSEEEIDNLHNDLTRYVLDKTGGKLRT
jgi:phenylalanyl-tRNA synthetase beta chain